MSLTFKSNATRGELVNFLAGEYKKDTGIPVHLYSVVNAIMAHYNRSLAITDNKCGTMFLEEQRTFKSYGSGNPSGLCHTLKLCRVNLRCIG